MSRFEDLPWVDEEGYLADQGRSFLQNTDQRISRLGLPDFLANSQKKIQELTTPVADLYSGIEQGLSSLPSAAQQASTNFLTSTTDRIGQLGQGIGSIFGDLGTGLQSSLEAQRGLEATTRDQEGAPPTAGQEVGPAGFTLPSTGTPEGERITSALSSGSVFPRTPPPSPVEGLRRGAQTLQQGVQDVGQELSSDLQQQGQRMGQQLGESAGRTRSVFDSLLENPVTGSGGDPALQSLGQRLAESRQSLGEQGGQIRTDLANAPQMFATGRGLEAAAGLGLRGVQAAGTALGAIPDAFGGAAVGALVGGEHNLAQEYGLNDWLNQRGLPGIQPDTLALGGLSNPAALGGVAAQAAAIPPTVVDEVVGLLVRQLGGQAVRLGTPVVERFLQEAGPGRIKVALEKGTAGLGDLFDDFVARTAERVPERLGGAEGPLGRLIGEEEGGLFSRTTPRPSRQITPPPLPGDPPAPTAPQTDGVARALADRVSTRVANEAAGAAPQAAAKLPDDSLLKTFDSPLSKLRTQWTDEFARVQDVVKEYERRLGRKLTTRENLYAQFRLFAGRNPAADARIQDELEPLARSVAPHEFERGEDVATMLDNADKARAVQNRVTAEVAGTEVGPVAGETALRNTNQSVRLRRANLGKSLLEQDAADDAYRKAQAELKRVRTEGRREVRGSQGRGRPRVQRTPAEQAKVEADAQARLDAAKQGTVDARTAAKEAARQANVDLSKTARADLKRLRLEGDVASLKAAQEAEIAEAAAAQGEQAAASRQFSGGVKGNHAPEDIWESEKIDVARELEKRLGRPVSQPEVDAAMRKTRSIVDGLQAYFRRVRQELGDAGIFPKELVAKWERDFPNYLPTNILKQMEEEGATPTGAGAKRFSVNSLPGGGLTEEGTTALRERPLDVAIRMAHSAESLIRRNRGAQALEDMIKGDKTGELSSLFRPLKEGEGAKTGETVFAVRRDGELHRYAVDKQFEPLFTMEPKEIIAWLQTISDWTGKKQFQGGATTYSARFPILNGMRDALILMRRAPQSLRDVPTVAKALGKSYGDVIATRGRGTPAWREGLRAGAGQESAYGNRSVAETRAMVMGLDPRKAAREARRAQQVTTPGAARRALDVALTGRFSPVEIAGNAVRGAGGAMRAVSSGIELAPRQAAYTLARARGAGPEAAALFGGRDSTMDFSRGGTMARQANALLPFFNAGIQGASRFANDLRTRPKATIGQAVGLLGIKMSLDAYNRQYGAEFDDVPNYQKDSGLIFMLPGEVSPEYREDGTPVPGQRNYLYFPLPQDLAAVLKAGSAIARRAGGEEQYGFDTGRGIVEGIGDLAGAALPVPAEVETVLPPLARQLVEQGSNYDFFRKRQIVPEYLQSRPAGEQATDRTSAFGRVVGGVTGPLTGLGPERVDHLVRGMLGGAGDLGLRSSDVLARAVGRGDLASQPYSRAEEPVSQATDAVLGTPVLGDLLGAVLRQRGGQLDETGRARLAAEADREKDAVRRELESSYGWSDLSRSEQQQILDEEYRKIEQEYRERGTDERLDRQYDRAQAQGAS